MSVCGRARTLAYRHRPAIPAPAESGVESGKTWWKKPDGGRRIERAAIGVATFASKRSMMFCRSPSTLARDLHIAVASALWLEGGSLSVGERCGAAIGARKYLPAALFAPITTRNRRQMRHEAKR